METFIVYVDDPDYAGQQLAPMLVAGGATHWVLVACAPRLTHRISKWVSHKAREKWRHGWADKLFAQLTPTLTTLGCKVTTVLAKGPLPELTQRLEREHGPARVMDARRPKFGEDLDPVTPTQAPARDSRWTLPGSVAGLSALLVLAEE